MSLILSVPDNFRLSVLKPQLENFQWSVHDAVQGGQCQGHRSGEPSAGHSASSSWFPSHCRP